MSRARVAVIGAGIVGLANAWSAAERGHEVTVYERSPRASGASIRNFGMVWPIGQPAGDPRAVALHSRARWLRLKEEAGLWVNACGSIHLAHRDDEWQVLHEFAERATGLGIDCELLGPAEVAARTSAVNPDHLRGGLWSPTELCVNPRRAVRDLPVWLAQRYGVTFRFETLVTAIREDQVLTARGASDPYDRIIVCSGADLETLYPDVYANADLRLCKLQMLKVASVPGEWRLGPHLASGLTLRHYRNFEICPSLPLLQRRIAAETPELDRYGIHVMASQNDQGEIILGDSHEYGDEIEPFDKSLVDDLVLRELRKILRLPDWTIAERWHGIYVKSTHGPVFLAQPASNVHVMTGTGGSGMTMAFGLAEQAWEQWSN